MPGAFSAFLQALRDQSGLDGGKLDLGLGAFPAVLRLTGSPAAALAVHLAVWAAFVAAWAAWLRPRLAARDNAAARLLCLTAPVLLCALLNPRLKSYDVATIFLLAIHAGHLWGRLRPAPPVLPLLALFAAVQINDPIGPTYLQMSVEALIVVLFYGLAARAVGRPPRPPFSLRPNPVLCGRKGPDRR